MASTVGLVPAWQPGQSGNPAGCSKKRRFQAAVRRALLERMDKARDEDELDQLGREVVNLALGGGKIGAGMLKELWAREDGPHETRVTGADGQPLVVFQPLVLLGIDPEKMKAGVAPRR